MDFWSWWWKVWWVNPPYVFHFHVLMGSCWCVWFFSAGWAHLWPWQRCWRLGAHRSRRMKSGVCCSPPQKPYWTSPKKVSTVTLSSSVWFRVQTPQWPVLMPAPRLGPGNICSVLSPGSVLLSANGSLAFKSCARYEDVASFTAPELQQSHSAPSRAAAEKVSEGFFHLYVTAAI